MTTINTCYLCDQGEEEVSKCTKCSKLICICHTIVCTECNKEFCIVCINVNIIMKCRDHKSKSNKEKKLINCHYYLINVLVVNKIN